MEINKCLEDPNTQYSDQYMPLAMMPAVVEAIQNAGGGGDIEIVNITMTGPAEVTVNKSVSGILSAFAAGKIVIGVIALPNATIQSILVSTASDPCTFEILMLQTDAMLRYEIVGAIGDNADEWTVYRTVYTMTPAE